MFCFFAQKINPRLQYNYLCHIDRSEISKNKLMDGTKQISRTNLFNFNCYSFLKIYPDGTVRLGNKSQYMKLGCMSPLTKYSKELEYKQYYLHNNKR